MTLVTPATPWRAISSSRHLEMPLIMLDILAASHLVHEALTTIEKDYGRSAKSLSTHLRDQKPTPIRTR
jgi:hypothetical protein